MILGRLAVIHGLCGIAMVLTLGGCGSSRVLDVDYQTMPATASVVVQPRRVAIRPVADRRMEPARVGSLSKDGDVVTRRPVVDIVREALTAEVTRAGHSVVTERWDVALAAEVEEFWLDVVRGYKKAQYIGRIAIAVAVVDGRGEPLVARRFVGIARREADEELARAGHEVMSAALARTMHDLATDPTVLAKLAATP